MRGRILAAAARLNYSPNAAARTLASQRSQLIGVICASIDHPGAARTLSAFVRTMSEEGFGVVVTITDSVSGVDQLLHARNLLARGVEAFALIGMTPTRHLDEFLLAGRKPFVWLDRFDVDETRPAVGVDVRRAMRVAVGYLIQLGHRRLGLIAIANSKMTSAVAAALDDAEQDARVTEASAPLAWDLGSGRAALRQLLVAANAPTALLCGDDMLAVGALRECQAQGLSVPRQMAVVGFGDHEIARQISPALTTLRVANSEIGRRGGAYLLGSLRNEAPEPAVEVATKLIVRESTGSALPT